MFLDCFDAQGVFSSYLFYNSSRRRNCSTIQFRIFKLDPDDTGIRHITAWLVLTAFWVWCFKKKCLFPKIICKKHRGHGHLFDLCRLLDVKTMQCMRHYAIHHRSSQYMPQTCTSARARSHFSMRRGIHSRISWTFVGCHLSLTFLNQSPWKYPNPSLNLTVYIRLFQVNWKFERLIVTSSIVLRAGIFSRFLSLLNSNSATWPRGLVMWILHSTPHHSPNKCKRNGKTMKHKFAATDTFTLQMKFKKGPISRRTSKIANTFLIGSQWQTTNMFTLHSEAVCLP